MMLEIAKIITYHILFNTINTSRSLEGPQPCEQCSKGPKENEHDVIYLQAKRVPVNLIWSESALWLLSYGVCKVLSGRTDRCTFDWMNGWRQFHSPPFFPLERAGEKNSMVPLFFFGKDRGEKLSFQEVITDYHPCVWDLKYIPSQPQICHLIMTSSNGNTLCITGSLCGESTMTGGFPSQRQVTWNIDIFFDLCLNKSLSKQLLCC